MDQNTASLLVTGLCVLAFLPAIGALFTARRIRRRNGSTVIQAEKHIDESLDEVAILMLLDREDKAAIERLADHDKMAYTGKFRQLVLRSLLAELEQKRLGIPIGMRRRLAELDQKEQSNRELFRLLDKATHLSGCNADFDGDALNVADCILDSDSTMRRMDPRLLWEREHAPYYDSEGKLLRKGSDAFDAYVKDLREREAKHIERLQVAEDNLQGSGKTSSKL